MAIDSAFQWGDSGEMLTPDQAERRRRMAESMLLRDEGQPMGWAQGLSSGLNKVMAAMMLRKMDATAAGNRQYEAGVLKDIFSGGNSGNPAATPGMNIPKTSATSPAWPGEETAAATPGGAARQMTWQNPDMLSSDYANAISAIESGGRYGLLGPVTKTGDRAYGKYQVMGNNIPSWTEAALGRRMTPKEFLSSPEAQDAVFNNRFGGYVNKYGPEGAAKAWFAGEGGMKNPNARDQLGTSVASYGKKFMRNLGGRQAAPVQVASLDGAVPMGGNPAAMPAANIEQQVAMSQAEPSWQEASALPNFAPPAAPQASPGAQRVAQAMPQGQDRLMMMLTDPRLSEGAKKIIMLKIQQQQELATRQNALTNIDLGNRVVVRDGTGREVQSYDKGEPKKAPTWGVIGKDPVSGVETYGYPPDPSMRSQAPQVAQPSVAPQPPVMPQNGLAVPPPPPGAHVPTWSKTATEEAAKAAQAQSGKTENIAAGLQNLRKMADTYDDSSFENALGPIQGATPDGLISGAPIMAARGLGEIGNWWGGGKSSLSEVRSNITGSTEALAAAIKPLIRKPGEGVWTDADQSRLVAIVGDLSQSSNKAEFKRRLNAVRDRIESNFGLKLNFDANKDEAGPNIDDLVKKYSK